MREGSPSVDWLWRICFIGRVQSETARPKAAILIFLSGGPSHVDMYDMKPDAPVEYRGEFRPIQSNTPGIDVCELMPLQAQIADRFTILRGFQGGNLHTGNEFFSGYPWQESPRASVPGEARRPALGSVVSRLKQTSAAIPPYVSIRSQHQWERAYYLGHQHEPFRIAENSGNIGTESLRNMTRPQDISSDRLTSRTGLLHSLDDCRRVLNFHGEASAMDAFQSRALEMVTSDRVRDAFDIEKESSQTRARYGEGLESMGQEPWKWLLQARRLVEAGVSVVTACTYGWDTHRTNFKTLRMMVPSLDRALHALIMDLEDRGLLDDVVVMLGGEFGRTPRIGDITPDGRGLWPEAGFLWLAGGGINAGQVIGQTDARGERVIGRPIFAQNVYTSLYQLLGIDPSMSFLDHSGRPQYLVENRDPVPGLV